MAPMSERPTADLILIIITGLVCLSVLLTGAGIFVLAITRPEVDYGSYFAGFSHTIGLLIGAVLG